MKAGRKILRLLARLLLFLGCFAVVYLLLMYTLSRIPVNVEDKDNASEITIFIKSNGVHTDLVLPVKSNIKNWAPEVDPLATGSHDSTYLYAAFGWGDRDFYLHTPQWSDLKISTALNAALYMGKGVMHVTFHHQLYENGRCRKVMISKAEYRRIIDFVSSSFTHDHSGNVLLIPNASYGDHDLFYEADSKYNLFYTCNSWANNGLKAGGQKAALWTLTDTGILCHYK